MRIRLNFTFAGVGSTLPAASTARTSMVCLPTFTFTLYGEVQTLNAPLSKRHSKRGVPLSSHGNFTLTRACVVFLAGFLVIVVSGAVVSTVKLRAAGVASRLVAASLARTENVCAPSGRVLVVNGLLQAANAAASTLHSKVAPASLENPNVGVGSAVGPLGPESIRVSAGVVSPTRRRPCHARPSR